MDPEITCSPKTTAGLSHPAIQHTARNRRVPVNISATAFLFIRLHLSLGGVCWEPTHFNLLRDQRDCPHGFHSPRTHLWRPGECLQASGDTCLLPSSTRSFSSASLSISYMCVCMYVYMYIYNANSSKAFFCIMTTLY